MSDTTIIDVGSMSSGMYPSRRVGELLRGQYLWSELRNLHSYAGVLIPLADATGFGTQTLDSQITELMQYRIGDLSHLHAVTLKEIYDYVAAGLPLAPFDATEANLLGRRLYCNITGITAAAHSVVTITVAPGDPNVNDLHAHIHAGDRVVCPDGNYYTVNGAIGLNTFELSVNYGAWGPGVYATHIRCLNQHGATGHFDWTCFAGNVIATNYTDPPVVYNGAGQFTLLEDLLNVEWSAIGLTSFRAKCVTSCKGFVVFGNVVLSGAAYDRLFMWCNLDDITTWVQAGVNIGANYEILNDSETGIAAMESMPPYGFSIYTRDKVYVAEMVANPTYAQVFSITPRIQAVGTFNPNSVCSFKNMQAFIGTDFKFYLFDGATINDRFSDPIRGYLENKFNARAAHLAKVCHIPHLASIAFTIPTGIATNYIVNETLLYNYESGAWSTSSTPKLTALSEGSIVDYTRYGDAKTVDPITGVVTYLPYNYNATLTYGDFIEERQSKPLMGTSEGKVYYYDSNEGSKAQVINRTRIGYSAVFSVSGKAELATLVKLYWESKNKANWSYRIGVSDSLDEPMVFFGRDGANGNVGYQIGDSHRVTGHYFQLELRGHYSDYDIRPIMESLRIEYIKRGTR